MAADKLTFDVDHLFRLLPVAALIVDSDTGRILEVNDQSEILFGLPRHDIIGKTPAYLSPECQPDGSRSEDLVKEKTATVAQGGGETFFWWHKHASGTQIPCVVQTSKLPILGSEIFIGFVTEITEQKEVFRNLLNYQHIFNNIDNPIAVVDSDYSYREVNPAYCRLFNKLSEDILGKRVADIIGKHTFKTIAKKKYDSCFSGEKVRFQNWYKIPEAGRRFFDIQYFPHYNAKQEVDAVISCVRDITEISALQNSLAESELRFKAFMDNIPANIYIKDKSDRHIYFNKQMEKSMGQNSADLIGKKTHDFFEADIADNLVKLDKQILTENKSSIIEEWQYVDDIKSFFIRDYKFPIPLQSGGKLLGGIAFDVTDFKINEQKLHETLKEVESLKAALEKENISLREELRSIGRPKAIVGESSALTECLSEAAHVSQETTSVLITGETGTGKELLAQAIHDMSPRKHRTMVKVNCAALPANLIESELFGREKGAYTGALTTQRGRFELADGSTLFLDEIGDLPIELQSKLLRVLQEGSFEMLGSTTQKKVDVRIIAATNQDLEQLVEQGSFRKDLYYRLNVFPIYLPSLRERPSDIPLLAYAFIEEFNESMGRSVRSIHPGDLEELQVMDWPGNVRELRNIVERSMILVSGPELRIRKTAETRSKNSQVTNNAGETLAHVERSHILQTLKATSWRVSGKRGAAEILGLKPTTLEARMKKLGIKRPI